MVSFRASSGALSAAVSLITVTAIGIGAGVRAERPVSATVGTQRPFSQADLDARTRVVRRAAYVVNARIRPLLLFWVGRNDIGDASLTWRSGAGDHRALEFLIGSDPARAPRAINRWGFIVEEAGHDGTHVFGVMKESNERTLEDAEAKVGRKDDVSTFKVAHTSVSGTTAVTAVTTVVATAQLTYRDLDALLTHIPAEPGTHRRVTLPAGTRHGFLVALEGLMRTGLDACTQPRGSNTGTPAPPVAYLYNQTIYDLSFTSCTFEPQLRTAAGHFAALIDGRFELRNRSTNHETRFRVTYGTTGALRGVPVRAVFRPRWWLEIDILLNPSTMVEIGAPERARGIES